MINHLSKTFAALKHRNFRFFFFGQMISLIGTWMQNVGQNWLIFQLTNSPFMLGLVSAVGGLPFLLFSLPGGVIADRVYKRNLLIITQSSAMILALILAILTSFHLIKVGHIIILAALLGLTNAFDVPSRQSFVIEMVGKEDLLNAIALNSSIFNAARIIGPAIAGFLIVSIGIAGCFYINSISYLAVIIGLLFIKTKFSNNEVRSANSVFQDLKEGLIYILKNSLVKTLISYIGILSIFGIAYLTLLPVFARDIFRVGPKGYGILMASSGIGALTGALFLASLGNYRFKGRLIIIGSITFSTLLILFAFIRFLPIALILLIVLGFSMVIQAATINSLLQILTPDNLRGRVMSLFSLMFMGLFPLGGLIAGAIAERFGVQFATAFAGIVIGITTVIILNFYPDVKKL